MKLFLKRFFGCLAILFLGVGCVFGLSSCRAEDQVQRNMMQDIGNFKTYRRITVINLRSNIVLMEFEGYITTKLDSEGDVNILIKVGPDKYQLHYVRLADEICYLSEQLDVSEGVGPYHHKITFYVPIPEASRAEE